jgi:6-phosphogluconate dehydrogenase
MHIGMVGLGRMGANMTTRLLRGGHTVVVWDRNADAVATAATGGASGAASLDDLVARLAADGAGATAGAPRVVWVMVPSGDATEQTIAALGERLGAGDVVVDGGNSNYQDSIRRARSLGERGVRFVDAGTSGGVWGLAEGYAATTARSPRCAPRSRRSPRRATAAGRTSARRAAGTS